MMIADSNDISDEAVFMTEANTVKILNFSGTQKGISLVLLSSQLSFRLGLINFSEAEGAPEYLDFNSRYLVVVTKTGHMKVFDVYSPNKPKPLGSGFQFLSNGEDNKAVRGVKVNSSGNKIAVLCDFIEGSLKIRHPDHVLYIYDRNKGGVYHYDLNSMQRFPISVFWDESDDRLLVCEAEKSHTAVVVQAKEKEIKSTAIAEERAEVEIVLFFATSEHGLLLQDSFPRLPPYGSLLGLNVPKIYFRGTNNLQSGTEEEKSQDNFMRVFFKIMRDFVGVDDIDDHIRVALLDFSYFLTLGKLDEAYKAVRLIDSPSIWENMAQMCVKTKRLDVAEVCLGNLMHFRLNQIIRQIRT